MRHIIAKIRGYLFIMRCKAWRRNIQIGSGLRIYKKLEISGKGKIFIGKDCLIDGITGDSSQFVCIDARDENAVIRIGCNARLYAARIAARFSICIGDDVLIEESAITDTNYHSIDRDRDEPTDENLGNSKIEIGDRVCIGARSCVMKGVVVGDDVVILPGSIVRKSIRAGQTVIGNPAGVVSSNS